MAYQPEDDYSYGYTEGQPSTLDWIRFGIGVIARMIFWLLLLFIVGNAVVQAFTDDQWVLGVLELALLPATFFIYPFAAPDDAMAWPFAEGTSFIPFLVGAFVAYIISTWVGGLDPID